MKLLLFLLTIVCTALCVTSAIVHDWVLVRDTNEIGHNNFMEFTFALKSKNLNVLEQHVLQIAHPRSQNYGQWLSQQEIRSQSFYRHLNLQPLKQWLHENNVADCQWYGDAVLCRAPVPIVNQLFQVEIKQYQHVYLRKTVFKADTNYYLPETIAHLVDFVDGISNPLPQLSLPFDRKWDNLPDQEIVDKGAVTRQVIQRVYNVSRYGQVNGDLISSGVIEFTTGEGFSQSDLLTSQIGNGIKKNPVKKNHIVGTDSKLPDIESELDIQFISQVGADADLWYWDTSLWLYTFAVKFFNTPQVPQVISLSWGWNEAEQCQIITCTGNETSKNYVQRVNRELLKITARGITICVASGDAGAPGRSNEGCSLEHPINPVFPGSSPWVTSVSATFLQQPTDKQYHPDVAQTPICQQLPCANGTKEYPTNFNFTGWTTGGGFDNYNPTPYWQQVAVQNYVDSNNITFPNTTYWHAQGRGYPDVSALGHNCAVYIQDMGGWAGVDGTSCSSPLFAGVVVLLNNYQVKHGRPLLGFLNPLLYQMHQDQADIFHDITEGNNHCTEATCCSSEFGFQAQSGWDPVTGLGTPNVGKMIAYLDALYQ